jgi:transcriptional regulator with XRE-family HTH domain
MIRARRKELGLRQEDLSPRIEIEGRPISQTHLSDLERGAIAPRPYLIEQFARALELNRDVLYLAAGIVPPEVAEDLNRLTPEEREEAWGRVGSRPRSTPQRHVICKRKARLLLKDWG